MQGIDWPVREVRKMGGSLVVTIPPHFRCHLQLVPGDWLSFWATYWAGYLIIKKVLKDLRGLTSRAAHERHPLIITQVKGKSKALWMVIPKAICEMLNIKDGDLLVFGWTLNEGEFSMAGILGGRNSEGENNEAQANILDAISTV